MQAKCKLIFIENNSIIDFAAIKCGYLARNLLIYNCSKDVETDDSLMRMLSEWHKNVSELLRVEIVTIRGEGLGFLLHYDLRRLQSEQSLFAHSLVFRVLKEELNVRL